MRKFILFLFLPSVAYAGRIQQGANHASYVPSPTSCAAVGTAIAFRATANDTAGTNLNDVVNKPAGTVDDDVMLAFCHLESDTPILGPPAGWTLVVSTKNTASTPDSNGYTFYKRAAGEGASYTFTHASAFSQCAIITYSGVNTGCGPLDTGQSTNTFTANTVWTGTSITTNFANNMLILEQDNFDTNPSAPPVSPAFTERIDTSNISIQEFKQVAAGSSGNASGSFSVNTTGDVCFVSLID